MPTSPWVILMPFWKMHTNAVIGLSCTPYMLTRISNSPCIFSVGCWIICSSVIRKACSCCKSWWRAVKWKCSVPALADAGIDYVTVNDYHFLCSGQQGHTLNGFYTTEVDGRRLDLFPISEALSYRSGCTSACWVCRSGCRPCRIQSTGRLIALALPSPSQ